MDEHEIAADHRAARQSVAAALAEVSVVEPGRVADAILARLAHLDPPLLVVRAEALDERERLRAVVDAVKEYRLQQGQFWLLENNEDEAVAAAERESRAWGRVVSALDQLAGSEEATDG